MKQCTKMNTDITRTFLQLLNEIVEQNSCLLEPIGFVQFEQNTTN